ncbi:DHHW family protein [Anaerolentibacter hominis]|uniref:DHHW family protein n=1 Tax=Anaerolentibacter hominis TaxID=3079009 RepID=UPI0031B8288D
MKNKLYILCFACILGIFSVGTIAGFGRTYSELENRYLESAPDFSVRNYFKGKVTAQVDAFVPDRLFGKDALIYTKTALDRLSGKRLLNEVYYRDGRYLENYKADWDEIEASVALYGQWARACEDVPFFLLPVPVNSNIYQDQLPKSNECQDQNKVFAWIRENLDESVAYVDVVPALNGHKNEDIYFLTDHHWTMRGAGYAWQVFAEQSGGGVKEPDRFERTVLSEDFYGTLFSKAPVHKTPKDKVEVFQDPAVSYEVEIPEERRTVDSFLRMDRLKLKDKYAVFFGGNYGLATIRNKTGGEGKLLVIKDSYANVFVPFLIKDYKEIQMVDERYFKQNMADYIKAEGFDRVLILRKF